MTELKEASGVSTLAIAQGAGLSYSGVRKMMSGYCLPRLDALIAAADYFGVPLDYLCGRCGEKEADRIVRDYPKYFMEMKRAAYEDYIGSRNRLTVRIPKRKDIPWPYNLLGMISDELKYSAVGKVQIDRLEKAMFYLRENEAVFLKSYYEKGETLEAIGRKHGITREAVRRTIAKGIANLKYLYGRSGSGGERP